MRFYQLYTSLNIRTGKAEPFNYNRMARTREEVIRRWGDLGLLDGLEGRAVIPPPIGRLFYMDFKYDFPKRKKYKITVILNNNEVFSR